MASYQKMVEIRNYAVQVTEVKCPNVFLQVEKMVFPAPRVPSSASYYILYKVSKAEVNKRVLFQHYKPSFFSDPFSSAITNRSSVYLVINAMSLSTHSQRKNIKLHQTAFGSIRSP